MQLCPVKITEKIKTKYNAPAFLILSKNGRWALIWFDSNSYQLDELYPRLNRGFLNLIQHKFRPLFRAHQ